MRIHLLGLPHTQTTDAFSHCAFTAKVQKMARMLRAQGMEVVHFGVEGATTAAHRQVDVLDVDTWHDLLGHRYEDPQRFVGTDARIDSPLYRLFNRRLRALLLDWVEPEDLVALPFGRAHEAALAGVPGIHVETGIGYPDSFQRFRIFESWAWYHFTAGRANAFGSRDWYVIPNYFDADEWGAGAPLEARPRELVYFGRLTEEKGLRTVWEIAKALPDHTVTLCGQGDPTPWLTLPNLRYEPPKAGRERHTLLSRARAVLMPTEYIEPFGGVAVEAMLSGTPVLASDHSAFVETIRPGGNGWRCRTLGDWLQGIARLDELSSPTVIAERAADRYGLDAVGPQYARVFEAIQASASADGWYTRSAPTLPDPLPFLTRPLA